MRDSFCQTETLLVDFFNGRFYLPLTKNVALLLLCLDVRLMLSHC